MDSGGSQGALRGHSLEAPRSSSDPLGARLIQQSRGTARSDGANSSKPRSVLLQSLKSVPSQSHALALTSAPSPNLDRTKTPRHAAASIGQKEKEAQGTREGRESANSKDSISKPVMALVYQSLGIRGKQSGGTSIRTERSLGGASAAAGDRGQTQHMEDRIDHLRTNKRARESEMTGEENNQARGSWQDDFDEGEGFQCEDDYYTYQGLDDDYEEGPRGDRLIMEEDDDGIEVDGLGIDERQDPFFD